MAWENPVLKWISDNEELMRTLPRYLAIGDAGGVAFQSENLDELFKLIGDRRDVTIHQNLLSPSSMKPDNHGWLKLENERLRQENHDLRTAVIHLVDEYECRAEHYIFASVLRSGANRLKDRFDIHELETKARERIRQFTAWKEAKDD